MPSAHTSELTIDQEFESMCRTLQPEEANLLEQDIIDHGCLDPIIVWENHDNIILDGHNRYRICTENGVGFKTRAISLPDREACLEWIDKHQLGKRNLTDEERTLYQGRLYNRRKKAKGGQSGNKNAKRMDQNEPFVSEDNTAKQLATELGDASPATIKRAGKFAEAIDSIKANVGEEVVAEILTGRKKSGLTKKDVVAVADEPAEQQSAAIERLRQKVGGSLKSEFDVLVERINKAIHTVEEMAASRMGQCSYSRAILASLGDAAKKAEAWRKKQEKE